MFWILGVALYFASSKPAWQGWLSRDKAGEAMSGRVWRQQFKTLNDVSLDFVYCFELRAQQREARLKTSPYPKSSSGIWAYEHPEFLSGFGSGSKDLDTGRLRMHGAKAMAQR